MLPLVRTLRPTWAALLVIVALQVVTVLVSPDGPRVRDAAWTIDANFAVAIAVVTAVGAWAFRHAAGGIWLTGGMVATLLAMRQLVAPLHGEAPPQGEVLCFYALAGVLVLAAGPGVLRPTEAVPEE